MKIHHVGYAVNNIGRSLKDLEILGYQKIGKTYLDEDRKVKIQFIKNEQVFLELIEPSGENSPVKNLLKKSGEGPYHICYETDNYIIDYKRLIETGYILVEDSKEAIALEQRNVAFFYKKGIGMIEILDNSK